MSKGNLVLEVRTDRNGKQVRRWVKPNATGSVSSFPVPAVPQAKYSYKRLLDVFLDEDERYDDLNEEELEDAISSFEPRTVEVLLDVYDEDNNRVWVLSKWLQYYESEEKLLREMALYSTVFDKHTDSEFIEAAVFEIEQYGFKGEEDYTDVSEEEQKQIKALLKMTEHIYAEDYEHVADTQVPKIRDNALRQLVFDNPDRLDEIVEAVAQRKVDDGAVIAEMLKVNAPLRTGTL